MDRRYKRIVYAVTVLILLFSGYVMVARRSNVVKIKILFSTPYTKDEVSTIAKLAERDINEYCRERESQFVFRVEVEEVPFHDTVVGSDSRDLNVCQANINIFKGLKKGGVRFVVGPQYSQQCEWALSCVGDDVIFISPYSSDEGLAIAGDSLLRLKCSDSHQGEILSRLLHFHGIEAIVISHYNNSWSDSIKQRLVDEYTHAGGVILDGIRSDTGLNMSDTMMEMDKAVERGISEYGCEKVGLVNLNIFDVIHYYQNLENYSSLRGVVWFGADPILAAGLKPIFESYVTDDCLDIKLYCPASAPSYSPSYMSLKEEYEETVANSTVDVVLASMYDACWLYAVTVYKIRSVDVSSVLDIIPRVSFDYIGISGNCSLNRNGDRMNAFYDFYEYANENEEIRLVKYGFYNVTANMIYTTFMFMN